MPSRFRPALLLVLAAPLAVALLGRPAVAQPAEDPDWPCVQRLVPELVPGMLWSGPALPRDGGGWEDDSEVRELARDVAARRTPLPEAQKQIDAFAGTLKPGERDARLGALFMGALDLINTERSSIVEGLKRFTRRQRELSDQITQNEASMRRSPGDDPAAQERMAQQQVWGLRLFDERERALTYLCEQPVLLEQRAFALGRHIARLAENPA